MDWISGVNGDAAGTIHMESREVVAMLLRGIQQGYGAISGGWFRRLVSRSDILFFWTAAVESLFIRLGSSFSTA